MTLSLTPGTGVLAFAFLADGTQSVLGYLQCETAPNVETVLRQAELFLCDIPAPALCSHASEIQTDFIVPICIIALEIVGDKVPNDRIPSIMNVVYRLLLLLLGFLCHDCSQQRFQSQTASILILALALSSNGTSSEYHVP